MEKPALGSHLSLPTNLEDILKKDLVLANHKPVGTLRYLIPGHPHLIARRLDSINFDEICETATIFNDLPSHGIDSLPYIPIECGEERYTLTLKVEGEDLEEMLKRDAVPPEVIDDIDILWANLTKYLRYKKESLLPSAADIYGPHQYMYGTVAGDDIPKLWLVDLGEYIDTFKSEESKENMPPHMLYYEYEGELLDLINYVLKIETYLDQPLSSSRQALLQSIDKISDPLLTLAFKNALDDSARLDPNVCFEGY